MLESWMEIRLLIWVWFHRVKFTVEEGEENEEQGNGLLVELEGKEEKKKRETDLWFSKVCFIVWSTGKLHFVQWYSDTSLLRHS